MARYGSFGRKHSTISDFIKKVPKNPMKNDFFNYYETAIFLYYSLIVTVDESEKDKKELKTFFSVSTWFYINKILENG